MGQLIRPANAAPVFSSNAYASPAMVPHALGTEGEDRYGRKYRFVRAGAVTLVVGNCLQAAAELTDHQAMTPADTAIGDKSITVTPGATAGAADLYADGIAVIDTTPGLGYSYPIKTHLAITASVAFVLQLATGWPVQVALTNANSKVTLYPNKYRGVIQSPVTTASGGTAGVCVYPIVATEYGWIGANGDFGTLVTGTPAIGAQVTSVGATAGAAAIWSSTLPMIGTMLELGISGKVQGVRWTL
jgi:hypothetical protein